MENKKNLSRFFTSVSEISNVYYKNLFSNYINKNLNILDFGCGSGELLNLIKCKYKIGIEINKFSQKKLKKKGIIFKDSLSKVNNCKFDLIFALSVIDHVKNPYLVIGQLIEKLNKGGKLIVIIRQDGFKQNHKNSKYHEHLYSWSILSFSNLLKNYNIKILHSDVLIFTLIPFYKFFKKFLNTKTIIFLSKTYNLINFKDKRLFFICEKK